MMTFQQIIENIDEQQLKKQLKEHSEEIKQVVKKKYKNNTEIAFAFNTSIKSLRLNNSNNGVKYLLQNISNLLILEEFVDKYYERSFYKVDVETKINSFVNQNRQQIIVFLNWFRTLTQENDEYSDLFSFDEEM